MFVEKKLFKQKREIGFLYLSEKVKFSIITIEERKEFRRVHAKKHPFWGRFKTEHLEVQGFLKKETPPKVFYYELRRVLVEINICVEHTWKSAYIRKI